MTNFEYFTSLTKRQLMKQVRETREHYNEVKACQHKGWDTYLGDNIIRVLCNARNEFMVAHSVLLHNYELSPAQIKEFKNLQLNK